MPDMTDAGLQRTQAAHSPTPWVVNGRGSAGWRIDAPGAERTGLDFLRHPVAVVPLEIDVDFIVTAVNAHDDLLALLSLLVQVAFDGPPTPMTGTEYQHWRKAADVQAHSLLAEIEEESNA